jgi:hypothetical protein
MWPSTMKFFSPRLWLDNFHDLSVLLNTEIILYNILCCRNCTKVPALVYVIQGLKLQNNGICNQKIIFT